MAKLADLGQNDIDGQFLQKINTFSLTSHNW